MNETLLSEFMRTDCAPFVRSLLLAAIARWDANEPPSKQYLEFDRFEFTLDAEEKSVLIEDTLDASASGPQIFSLEQLKAALGAPS